MGARDILITHCFIHRTLEYGTGRLVALASHTAYVFGEAGGFLGIGVISSAFRAFLR